MTTSFSGATGVLQDSLDELPELASATDEVDACCMGVTDASGSESRGYLAWTFLSLTSEVWSEDDVDVGSDIGDASDANVSPAVEVPSIV